MSLLYLMTVAGKKGVGEEGGYKMEVRLVDKNDNKANFILKDVSPAVANTFRRIMISEVPVMAIEDVELRKNSSVLYDEIIAHRLGLTPLTTDLKTYNLLSECKCKGEGCARCSVKLTLAAKGPCTVYASELKSKDPKIKPVYPKMPIAKLLKDQELELEATAFMGTGKDHTKFSPCLAFYKYRPQIEIKGNPEDVDKVVQSCPVDIYKNEDGKLALNKDNLMLCHLCNACVEMDPKNISVEAKDDEFVFYVESWGQLDCKEIALAALDMLKKRMDEFDTKLKEAKS
ncbi:DNA-directed RNA polymerase subunit D [Candidatus Woesearchaeota archaeon]|nr:DNA-directed RNA polymerase subunit D [Candidatus Woesearchaeota archaeon]